MSMRVNCWEIGQVTSKYRMDVLNKTWKLKTENEKSTTEIWIFKLV